MASLKRLLFSERSEMINEFLVTDISDIVFSPAFQELIKHPDSFLIGSVKEIGWFYAIHESDSIIIYDV